MAPARTNDQSIQARESPPMPSSPIEQVYVVLHSHSLDLACGPPIHCSQHGLVPGWWVERAEAVLLGTPPEPMCWEHGSVVAPARPNHELLLLQSQFPKIATQSKRVVGRGGGAKLAQTDAGLASPQRLWTY